jgi:hypothetical protein
MKTTELARDSIEFRRISHLVHKTLSSNEYQIVSILRNDDPQLDERYERCRALLKSKRHKDPQEIQAFHGCSLKSAAQILSNGFNHDFNVCSAYGKGNYFSPNANTSIGYCKNERCIKTNSMYMILSYLLLGEACAGGSYNSKQLDTEKFDYSTSNMTTLDTICLPIDEAANPKYLIQIHHER